MTDTADPATGVSYDPFAPATMHDPFAAYAELLAHCPVHRYDGFTHPLYTVTRHADVTAVLTDIELWSSHYGQSPRYTVQGCLFSDPPAHTLYRKLVQKSFAPRHVAAMEGEIAALVDELLDAMEPKGAADLHDDLACPLPVIVIAKILGVPPHDINDFKAWSDQSVAAMGSPDPHASDAPRAAIAAYFTGQLEHRRGLLRAQGHDPATAPPEVLGDAIPDDVVSGMLVAEVDGRRLTDPEILVILNQLLVGGNETTTSLITNLFWRILERPELAATIRADPSLDVVAVEEGLRRDAPVLGLYRTATRDTELHGVPIPEKAKLMATYGAANHDPDVFPDPLTFRLDRDPEQLRKHLAFGLGHHFCVGAHLSRLEARIALRHTLDRFPDLRLVDPGERIAPYLLWGRKHLPVAW